MRGRFHSYDFPIAFHIFLACGAQAGHVKPPPTDVHTYLPIYPFVAALLYDRAYLNESALLCNRLYLYLAALCRGRLMPDLPMHMADGLMESARTGKQ